MSHIVTIDTELKDVSAIKKACERMGWTYDENAKTFAWYGRYVGDYAAFEERLRSLGISTQDYGKCDAAIKIPGANYTIGLVEKDGKYIPLWDTWGPGGLSEITTTNGMGGFMQAYVCAKTQLEARRKGYSTREVVQRNGDTKIEIVVP